MNDLLEEAYWTVLNIVLNRKINSGLIAPTNRFKKCEQPPKLISEEKKL